MKEIVKYSNELNKVNFSSLKETQLNVLFTILAKIRHENTKDGITIPTKELFELADINNGGGYRANLLSSLGVLQDFKIQYTYERNSDKNATAQEVIFPRLQIYDDKNGEVLNVKVSEAFRERYLKAMPQFTRFELEEFVNLSGTYAKTIYRFLKQYRQTGVWRVKYKDFIELLGIPESYRATNIDQQILKPVIKQLSTERNLFDLRRIPFKGLMVRKIKSGKFIEALEFCFIPQPVSELEKDEKENERNLATIARDIQREERLRSLKQNKIDELKAYLFQSVRVKNPNTQEYDTLKIIELNYYQNKIKAKLKNSDDDYITEMTFESIKHLQTLLGF